MARKPARMYTTVRGQPYTRREYMGGVPGHRIAQFRTGTPSDDYPVQLSLCVKERCQIRSIALEAARVTANKVLSKKIGVANFYFRMRVYPHNVLRENKQATGAGADRVSDGMRRAFGKPVGTAARVEPGQPVFTVWTYPQYFKTAKDALRKAGMKIPSPTRIVTEKGEHLVS
ncbi:MAG: 50S ribosomal protein L16 [Thermoplasmata archaeon]|nr:50S ribosomal protein L16 [Thermoplasmata archaeon]